MIGGAQATADKVESLLNEWVPSEVYDHERKFQSELQEYLDTRLNDSRGVLDGGEEFVVSTEHGRSKGDVVVNDVVGIELKRDLSNSQTKKLAGQIQSYRDEYDFVFVVACGIDDMDGWRRMKNQYEQRGLDPMQMEQAPVVFIHKDKSRFGTLGTDSGRVDGSGGAFGKPSTSQDGGGEIDLDVVVREGVTGLKELTSDGETEMSSSEAMMAVLQLGILVAVAIIAVVYVAQVLLL